ncbi:MAG: leucyl aminopeptidase [Candidatus Omnitrophica bacterium]|nr:leucyl aminopeptidase [Candidatus Omnitrophota bacterium]
MKISFKPAKAAPKAPLAIAARFSDESRLELTPTSKAAPVTFFIGLGKREKCALQKIRLFAAKAVDQAKSMKLSRLRIDVDSFEEHFPGTDLAAALVEGAELASYRFDRYKSKKSPEPPVEELELVSNAGPTPAIRRAMDEAETVCEGVFFTRDLANEPANVMTPDRLAKSAAAMAKKNGLTCRVLGLAEIKRLKMGGILGVSQGSANEPRFIILENKVKTGKPIVLVGKGITFDTGGISIKPSNDMDKMKFDMCGAAAVIGAMKVVADLKLPVKVVGLVPTCENMPGGRAQRPGDIVRFLNGKTAEVLNTDAEGRLILADALAYAERYKPKALVDIATLTGACAATFGDKCSGLMGTDADLVHRMKEAGEKSGERVWELPLWDEYNDLIRGNFADIQNISKKMAGTITAAMFLKEFAEHTPSWAHLDIAGTAWTDKGATGVGVRLFVELVKSYL